MRKLVSTLLIIIMCISVIACGNKAAGEDNAKADGSSKLRGNEFRLVQVEEIEGTASLNRDSNEEELVTGLNLIPDDTVTTDEESRALFRVDDDKHIYEYDNSQIKISAAGSAESGTVTVDVVNGIASFAIENKLSDDSHFIVNTPTTTMAVRGTTFSVKYNMEKEESQVYVAEGTVWLVAGGEQEERTQKLLDKSFQSDDIVVINENDNFIIDKAGNVRRNYERRYSLDLYSAYPHQREGIEKHIAESWETLEFKGIYSREAGGSNKTETWAYIDGSFKHASDIINVGNNKTSADDEAYEALYIALKQAYPSENTDRNYRYIWDEAEAGNYSNSIPKEVYEDMIPDSIKVEYNGNTYEIKVTGMNCNADYTGKDEMFHREVLTPVVVKNGVQYMPYCVHEYFILDSEAVDSFLEAAGVDPLQLCEQALE